MHERRMRMLFETSTNMSVRVADSVKQEKMVLVAKKTEVIDLKCSDNPLQVRRLHLLTLCVLAL